METAAAVIAIALATTTLAVSLWTLAFARVFFRPRPKRLHDDQCPRAAVLMGLKGCDPFLWKGLRRLLSQDYPNYDVHFVVDSRDDPAWPLVEEAIAETQSTNVSLQEFRDLPENGIVNCTNSKVVQALRSLPEDSVEIIAMADGDVVADENWLRDLVAPLVRDDSIGVTYGNRWFIPPRFRMGTLVRSLWNMAATSIMYHQNMPWGGCYATRMRAVREGGLIEKWAKVGALDMFTTREMKRLGLKIEFVPTLMMVNREECGLPFSFNFIRRQITWAQLYNPVWPLAVLQSALGAGMIGAAIVLLCLGFVQANSSVVGWSAAGLAVYCFGLALAAIGHHFAVRRMLIRSRQTADRLTLGTILALPLALPLTVFVYFAATLHCLFCKRIAWRGSLLEFNGPHDIRVIEEAVSTASPGHAAAGAESA